MKGVYRPSLDRQEFWALQDVSFYVERGEAFGIIGSNGAGKSTILKLLSGIMRPTSGSICVKGRLSALIEISAGLHPDLTGRENIYLNGTILGLKRPEIRARFDEIVAFSGLEEFIDTPVKRYSSGMHARLGFSVAAHVDPDILVVDEVLSVGDLAFQRKCMERMDAVLKRGTTVVFISHNLTTVASLCVRSLLLERGRTVAMGPSEEVIRAYLAAGDARRDSDSTREVFIARVEIRDGNGPRSHFHSGEKGYIDVEVVGNGIGERVAVVVAIGTANVPVVFNTSTEWLGTEAYSLAKGERVTCTFGLHLHLATGTYHVSAWIYRHDIEKRYDAWDSAKTFFVTAERDNRGVANLYPELQISRVEPVSETKHNVPQSL